MTLVEALTILKRRGSAFHCTLAASGSQEPLLRQEVSARGLADRVTFLGGYHQHELPRLLEEADAYISTAPNDGASVSLLEAMASGLFPVVADIPGNREWISGQGDGLLFRSRDAVALAEALSLAIENDGLRRGSVAINRERVSMHGERQTNLRRLRDAYRTVLDAYRHA